ncbi:MAG: DinB family protein, partial [Planctomycetota bacterium]
MNYYGGKDLAASFRTVRGNTLKLAADIPEDKYNFRASPETKTVGQLLVHIALSPRFARQIHGGKVTDLKTVNFGELMQTFGAEEAKPRNKAEIVSFLTTEGDAFAAYLDGLSDDFLAEKVTMM